MTAWSFLRQKKRKINLFITCLASTPKNMTLKGMGDYPLIDFS